MPPPLVEMLCNIVRLREASSIDPSKLIADLKARILDRAHHAVKGARPAKGDQMRAWLEHPQHLGPESRIVRDLAGIPFLAHEAARQPRVATILASLCRRRVLAAEALDDRDKGIGRISDTGVVAAIGNAFQNFAAISGHEADSVRHAAPFFPSPLDRAFIALAKRLLAMSSL